MAVLFYLTAYHLSIKQLLRSLQREDRKMLLEKVLESAYRIDKLYELSKTHDEERFPLSGVVKTHHNGNQYIELFQDNSNIESILASIYSLAIHKWGHVRNRLDQKINFTNIDQDMYMQFMSQHFHAYRKAWTLIELGGIESSSVERAFTPLYSKPFIYRPAIIKGIPMLVKEPVVGKMKNERVRVEFDLEFNSIRSYPTLMVKPIGACYLDEVSSFIRSNKSFFSDDAFYEVLEERVDATKTTSLDNVIWTPPVNVWTGGSLKEWFGKLAIIPSETNIKRWGEEVEKTKYGIQGYRRRFQYHVNGVVKRISETQIPTLYNYTEDTN